MELSGERYIPADQETVWQALNDAEVLKTCIPGCEEIAWSGDNKLEATVKAKVGPVKAKFKGAVELSEIDAPNSYVISGQGKGGAAGFAKGSAHVTLCASEDGTLLSYEVKASVGGKLAQVGSRLIQGTANKLAEQFFDAISERLGGETTAQEAPEREDQAREDSEQKDKDSPAGLPPAFWAGTLAALLALSLWYFS